VNEALHFQVPFSFISLAKDNLLNYMYICLYNLGGISYCLISDL
jgi:hypothetical protein